ncbi:MAG: prepilin-type N-terminal cleavage/methylation domain-containing protein [Gammaproteobacteria bacterium]|nr:prepilin-type N-terminal cleavage/methylation domain-containing protein [Gammaproteobacteria bacterium]MBP9729211.1 prepilin-type N-terminal cleavage/methylation domain-containing protein [Gammaproteobacteria bacterium]
MVRQSAFSLIEVLIALLCVSISTAALNKVLLDSCYYFRRLAVEQSITTLAWNICEAFRFLTDPSEAAETLAYWRQRLKLVDPQSDLKVQCSKVENRWVYTIQVQSSILSDSLTLQVFVEAAAS